jgi:FMN-dependent NADH-azoreductase
MNLLQADSGILGTSSVSRRLSAAAVAQWRERYPGTMSAIRSRLGPYRSSHRRPPCGAEDRCRATLDHDASGVGRQREGARGHWYSHVQFRNSEPTQGLDRQACGGRQDIPVHRKRTARLGRRKDGQYRMLARGFSRCGHPVERRRSSGTHLSTIFCFFGITDIHFVRAEGVNVSVEQQQKAIAAAGRNIVQLLAA